MAEPSGEGRLVHFLRSFCSRLFCSLNLLPPPRLRSILTTAFAPTCNLNKHRGCRLYVQIRKTDAKEVIQPACWLCSGWQLKIPWRRKVTLEAVSSAETIAASVMLEQSTTSLRKSLCQGHPRWGTEDEEINVQSHLFFSFFLSSRLVRYSFAHFV